MNQLSAALSDGACLIESTSPASDLKSALVGRLSRYYANLGFGEISSASSLEDVQLTTAKEALSIVIRVQRIVAVEEKFGTDSPPLIGTRDLAELRTLLSIVFKWGVHPLFAQVMLAWADKPPVRAAPRIIDLTTTTEDYSLLSSMTSDLLHLLFPDGVQGRISQTLITTTILQRHAMDLLKPSITLGWLPKTLASDSAPVLDVARPLTMRFLNLLSPLQTITALGGILSSAPPPVAYVRKVCISLLGQQLLRPQGVRGLCAAVFGEDQHDSPIEKLQHVARVLTTVPANVKPDDYFGNIIPKIMSLLLPEESVTNKRAAAYVISRMLSMDGSSPHQDLTSKMTLSILHRPFLSVSEVGNIESPFPSNPPLLLAPSVALSTLITLVSNADPSPTLISALLSPIIPTLYSLLYYIDTVKTIDPSLRESLRGLLVTCAKIVGTSDGVYIFWSISESEEQGWSVDLEGDISRAKLPDRRALSFLTPEDIKADTAEDFNLDTNILGLYPDPTHYVRLLKTIDRVDISSDLFVKLLEAYREHKSKEPTRALLYLQIIMQMQAQLTEGKSSANILCKPTHLLSFVRHVLEPSAPLSRPPDQKHQHSSVMDTLRLRPDQDDGIYDEVDSDDELPGDELITADEDLIETSLNLLLSVLEANEDLSARSAPVLNDIFSLLEPLAREGSEAIRSLAREAKMVMTARLASASSQGKSASRLQSEESAQEIYQKALKLLQDPILPVRAHGLLLLRQLVTPTSRDPTDLKLHDHALVPAILSIFLQSVQDDDSYVFLNAVQGLAAMVDTFGKEVLKGLVKEYAEGLDGLRTMNLTQRDVDTRIRVGEALAAAIRRCGEALGIYVDILVPPLFNILRLRQVPTALRTSSLSLLADCESASPLAMLPYTAELAEAMIDVLQVETVPAKPKSTAAENGESEPPTMDSEPVSTNPRFPPLRRAALHFLSLLIRETTKQIYDSTFGDFLFQDTFMKRAKATLGYVASTDEDNIVRVMSREASEGLNGMNRAMMGL